MERLADAVHARKESLYANTYREDTALDGRADCDRGSRHGAGLATVARAADSRLHCGSTREGRRAVLRKEKLLHVSFH